MFDLPLAYAFAAGLAASVNPCGFMMLPAFAAYRLGVQEGPRPLAPTLLAAAQLALVATVGFVVVFAATGVVLGLGGRALLASFPWAGLGVGVILAALGVWLLVGGRSLGLAAVRRVQFRPRGGILGTFLFGIGYAVASLGCTLPIFLVVVGGALSSDGLVPALATFVSYALGMGAVLPSPRGCWSAGSRLSRPTPSGSGRSCSSESACTSSRTGCPMSATDRPQEGARMQTILAISDMT